MTEGVLVRYLTTLQDVLRLDYNINLTAFFDKAGLEPLSRFDPADHVPMAYADRLWEAAAHVSDHMLGMNVGKRVRYRSYAGLGQMLITCETVEDAIRASSENIAYVGAGSFELIEEQKTLKLVYEPHSDSIPAIESRVEASLLPFSQLARLATGGVKPLEVHLKRQRPDNPDIFSEMFRAPVKFDTGSNAIIWRLPDIAQPMQDANPALNALLRTHVKRELENPATATFQLKTLFETWFAADLSNEISLVNVAGILGLSARSLQRKLAIEHTSFRAELMTSRLHAADRYLKETSLSIAEIASRLGYSEPAPFVRAFQAQKNLSPGRYRQKVKAATIDT